MFWKGGGGGKGIGRGMGQERGGMGRSAWGGKRWGWVGAWRRDRRGRGERGGGKELGSRSGKREGLRECGNEELKEMRGCKFGNGCRRKMGVEEGMGGGGGGKGR